MPTAQSEMTPAKLAGAAGLLAAADFASAQRQEGVKQGEYPETGGAFSSRRVVFPLARQQKNPALKGSSGFPPLYSPSNPSAARELRDAVDN